MLHLFIWLQQILWLTSVDCLYNFIDRSKLPYIEKVFDPGQYEPDRVSNGTTMPARDQTPDFRIDEDTWYAYAPSFYKEENRPYRISPHYKQTYKWSRVYRAFIDTTNKEYPDLLGCYCCTVFKRVTLLAGCAVITSRHILTTATSTELVLKDWGQNQHLTNILGAWYDHNGDVYNSSLYMTPARIHYHPEYLYVSRVNTTHPLPVVHDLSVWAATYKFMGHYFTLTKAVICSRGGPHWWQYLSSTPRYWDLAHIVGFQFMKAFRRRPMPWYKYVIRSRSHTVPCPKTDWGWMHCIPNKFMKYGVESGAAWHRATEGRYWFYDGIIGMCAFSMRLRSEELTHYFTVLNTHPVLDFLYAAYMGRLPYKFLDYRFYDTQWKAPVKQYWAWIDESYTYGEMTYNGFELPYY